MAGKQLVPYDPDRPHAYQNPKRSFSERVGDGLEGYATGEHDSRFVPQLVAKLAGSLAVSVIIVAVFTAFSPQDGFIGPFRSRTPEWLTRGGGTDAALIEGVQAYLMAIAGRWRTILVLFSGLGIWTSYQLVRTMLPLYFLERKRRREAGEQQREQHKRDYQGMIAQREEEARLKERQAEQERDSARWAEAQRRKDFLRTRAEALLRLEKSVGVQVARAQHALLADIDATPETPFLLVRTWMQQAKPMPTEWGLLHESADLAVKKVIGTGDWLPPRPPNPYEERPILLK